MPMSRAILEIGEPIIIEVGDLSEVLARLLGMRVTPAFDFGSAHYFFELDRDMPREVENQLAALARKGERNPYRKVHFWERTSLRHIDSVLPEIIQQETSLDLSQSKITPWGYSTREVIRITLDHLLSHTNKKVALPVPNWHFWLALETQFAPFEAYSGEELVDNFRRVANDDIGALILSFPATPLMYTPTQEQLMEIDHIAQHHGITVVIDDVLRGVQPLGKRDTVGRFFTRPYIIEGYGKRLGESFGSFSHLISPKDSTITNDLLGDSFSYGFGTSLAISYEKDTQRAVQELERRNAAFDRGVRKYAPEGVTCLRPSPSHITTLLQLPHDFGYSSTDFTVLAEKNGICVSDLADFFPADFSLRRGTRPAVRITTGRMDETSVYNGAETLGRGISILCGAQYGQR